MFNVILKRILLTALLMPISVLPGSASAELHCAKDMFFDQLESPAESINTGLKYWIQLRRKGKISLVDNRTKFYSGDEIRFQIIPNISGFAYVILAKGSSGQQKVLYPNQYETKGKVTAGKQIMLPARGFLQFDKTAGTENVRLAISRHPVSAASLLATGENNSISIVSSAQPDQLIQNQNCLVAFASAEGKGIDFPAAIGKSAESLPVKNTETSEFAKDLNYVPAVTRVRFPKHRAGRVTTSKLHRNVIPPVERRGSVTIINIEPNQNLAADIQLTHL